MKIDTGRHFTLLCCVLSVFCVSALWLSLYSTGWLDTLLLPPAPRRVSALPKRYERRPQLAPTPEQAIADQNATLVERDEFYRSLPTQDIQKKRLDDQVKLLEEYDEDPDAFVKKY